ncbi:MAG TPA: 3'(2'),5'-bisphosphate nucleotidase CysQ, partial [Oceanospirillales bacterium]|nr:3'(2'),5'-bisphosphate nucleotidase CysQ [Oceanospirillales bacterium]
THKPARNIPIVVGSRSHLSEDVQTYLNKLGEHNMTAMGSSLKFCIVAEGQADLYPRLGLTSEWDTAAAQCIVEQAGGRVVTLDNEALIYNSKESLLNPYFMVYGDASRDWINV